MIDVTLGMDTVKYQLRAKKDFGFTSENIIYKKGELYNPSYPREGSPLLSKAELLKAKEKGYVHNEYGTQVISMKLIDFDVEEVAVSY